MMKKDMITVFIPLKGSIITPLKNFIGKLFGGRYKHMEIKEYFNHFGEALENANLPYPKRLILFAHPDKNYLGLKVNGGDDNETLLPEWWKKSDDSPYEMMFAYACEGDKVFNQDQWRRIFPNWISFNKKVHIFALSKQTKSAYKKLYKGIAREISKKQPISVCKNNIEKEFESIISNLYDKQKKENGDTLALLYLIDAYNSLCTSED
jgi:hypothetical protein